MFFETNVLGALFTQPVGGDKFATYVNALNFETFKYNLIFLYSHEISHYNNI